MYPQNKKSKRVSPVRLAVTGAFLTAGLALGSSAQASLMFSFDYSGNAAGVGFLDATQGTARQNALTLAGTKFSELFGTYFSDSATIVMAVTSSDNPSSTTLASAGSQLTWQGSTGFTLGEVVQQKLQSGGVTDLNGAAADGQVDVNFANLWELDYNTEPATNVYDFYSTLFHEFTHAIGFTSTISQAGRDVYGYGSEDPAVDAGTWNKFDSFLVQCGGANVIDSSSRINQAVWDAASVGDGSPNGLCFNGGNAVLANGGNLIELYSPNPWAEGSSGSHLNTNNPQFTGSPQNLGSMMRHNGADGSYDTRSYSTIEVGMLTDLGYTRNIPPTNNVPEPGTLALLLASLAGTSLIRRRNKKA